MPTRSKLVAPFEARFSVNDVGPVGTLLTLIDTEADDTPDHVATSDVDPADAGTASELDVPNTPTSPDVNDESSLC